MTLVLILKRRWWYPIQDVDNPHRLASGKPYRGQIDYDQVKITKKKPEETKKKIVSLKRKTTDDRVIPIRALLKDEGIKEQIVIPTPPPQIQARTRELPQPSTIPVVDIIDVTTVVAVEDTLTDDIIMILGGLL